jgi:hypothetical protein
MALQVNSLEDIDKFVQKYQHRLSPVLVENIFLQPQYEKLFAIITSFHENFPIDILLLIIDYYSCVFKWVECDQPLAFNLHGISAYDSYRDEYVIYNNTFQRYSIIDSDDASKTEYIAHAIRSTNFGVTAALCFDLDGNYYMELKIGNNRGISKHDGVDDSVMWSISFEAVSVVGGNKNIKLALNAHTKQQIRMCIVAE